MEKYQKKKKIFFYCWLPTFPSSYVVGNNSDVDSGCGVGGADNGGNIKRQTNVKIDSQNGQTDKQTLSKTKN